MAPKRSAQPPPPVESSEDRASGSSIFESEEITHSPPAAAPKNTAPPPQMVQQPEASDDEEEGEEEEDTSSSASKNPLPPQKREESESDEEEEQETDDEAPQSMFAPKLEVKVMGENPPPSSKDKKPTLPFQRSWSEDDEVRILEALAAYRREHGTLPQPEDLEAVLAGSLDNSDYGCKDLMGKVKILKSMYFRTVKRAGQPRKDHNRRIFSLAKKVWGGSDMPANGTLPRDFSEICQMYPYLAEEMKALERTWPGLFKREFSMIDDEKARKLDQKIKKQRFQQMKVELRGHDVDKEVTKTLMDLLK